MPEARAALLGSEQLCEEYGSLHSTRNVAPELWPPPADYVGRKKEMKAGLGSGAGPRIAQQSRLESAQALLCLVLPSLPAPPASLLSHTASGRGLRGTWREPHLGYRRGGVAREVGWERQYMITTRP